MMWLTQIALTGFILLVHSSAVGAIQSEGLAKILTQLRSGSLLAIILGLFAIGIFHGSGDLYLLRGLSRRTSKNEPMSALADQGSNSEPRDRRYLWIVGYLALIVISAAFLLLLPQLFLGLFLAVSAYHFGESQLWPGRIGVQKVPARELVALRLIWGTWVISAPLLIEGAETQKILHHFGLFPTFEGALLTGLGPLQVQTLVWSFFFLAACGLLWLHGVRSALSRSCLLKELLSLALLQALFLSAPLLIGFGTYFLVWHSLGSCRDQMAMIPHLYKADPSLSSPPGAVSFRNGMTRFVRSAFPYWFISVIALGVLLWASSLKHIQWSAHVIIFGGAMILTPSHLIVLFWLGRFASSAHLGRIATGDRSQGCVISDSSCAYRTFSE